MREPSVTLLGPVAQTFDSPISYAMIQSAFYKLHPLPAVDTND